MFKYVRQGFGAGTRNVSKQVLENINVAQLLNHRCLSKKRELTYGSKTTKKADDTLAFTRQGFFKIVQENEDGTYLGYLVDTSPFSTDHLGLGSLEWSQVGVARLTSLVLPDLEEARENDKLITMDKASFLGKGVQIGRTLSWAPQEWASLQLN